MNNCKRYALVRDDGETKVLGIYYSLEDATEDKRCFGGAPAGYFVREIDNEEKVPGGAPYIVEEDDNASNTIST